MSGQNKVEVNESELRAELDTILAEAILEERPPPVATGEVVGTDGVATDAQPVGDSWVVLCQGVVPVLAITVLPQWNITADEKNELAQSLGLCLDQIAPGGLSGKYACWARLVFCMGGIAVSRAMANGGKLPAFGPRKPVVEKTKNESAAPNQSAAN